MLLCICVNTKLSFQWKNLTIKENNFDLKKDNINSNTNCVTHSVRKWAMHAGSLSMGLNMNTEY